MSVTRVKLRSVIDRSNTIISVIKVVKIYKINICRFVESLTEIRLLLVRISSRRFVIIHSGPTDRYQPIE
jgi:hypothetical protein